MSAQTTQPGTAEQSAPRPVGAGPVRDVAWVVGYFVLAGVIAGLVWWQVVTPPYFVRTAQGGVMEQAQLGRRIQADGWFVTIGAVAGLVGGVVLTRWRVVLPLLTVLVGFVSSLAAGALALEIGRRLGHRDVTALLKSAKVGGHVTDKLDVISTMVVAAWPIGFLIGAVAILLGTKSRQPDVKATDLQQNRN